MLIVASLLFIISFISDLYVESIYTPDILRYASMLLLFIYSYTNTVYSNVLTRLILAITSCLCAMYIVMMVLMYTTDQEYLDRVYLVSGFLFSLLFVRVSFLKFDARDKFKESGTFLAYKKPRDLQGYLASLVWGYGTVALVINGKEFKFKSGKFIEREHVTNSRYIYKKTNHIPLEKARLMIGTSWKWYRNCFTLITGDISNATERAKGNGSRGHKQ